MEYYSHHFDEDSGNNRIDGINEVLKELQSDFRFNKREYEKAKKDL